MKTIILLAILLSSCGMVSPPANVEPDLVGTWRNYPTPTSRVLDLYQDGTWGYGSSRGTWTVTEIEASDWEKWGVPPYGPTRKITLYGWDGDVGDGPIEESNRVDFFWVIYVAKPPAVEEPTQVQLKFGH